MYLSRKLATCIGTWKRKESSQNLGVWLCNKGTKSSKQARCKLLPFRLAGAGDLGGILSGRIMPGGLGAKYTAHDDF